jgi:hypothetical protein
MKVATKTKKKTFATMAKASRKKLSEMNQQYKITRDSLTYIKFLRLTIIFSMTRRSNNRKPKNKLDISERNE